MVVHNLAGRAECGLGLTEWFIFVSAMQQPGTIKWSIFCNAVLICKIITYYAYNKLSYCLQEAESFLTNQQFLAVFQTMSLPFSPVGVPRGVWGVQPPPSQIPKF
jgi:hypothetical protein